MSVTGYDKARQLVQILLKGAGDTTLEKIRGAVDSVLKMLQAEGNTEPIDREGLSRDIESRFNVWVGQGTSLQDNRDHEVWLPTRRSKMEWKFWKRYERYLEEDIGWAPATVARLDELTDSVLEKLEDPARKGPWDRRGMAVGQVQSGKTSNYIGLICKAVDAGYKLIIVLAGMHKNLRSQTQLRIDLGFLGFDTQLQRRFDQKNLRIGVGALSGADFLIANSLTSSADDGDFSRAVANQIGVVPGSDPIVLVVKKNKSVLDNLRNWATSINVSIDPKTGKPVVRNVPLLLIDDEADNASINTKPKQVDDRGNVVKDEDVTAINGAIRGVLNSFEKCAYVGYTATPFANIFIHPEGESDRVGEDLFPRSFIVNLPTPSNYISPARVFGFEADPDSGLQDQPSLPIVCEVDDFEPLIPNAHRKDLFVPQLPGSLLKAIKVFILASAARACRGQADTHNSMLVHVTRFTNVQQRIAQLISDDLRYVRQRLEHQDGDSTLALLSEFERLWKGDFLPISIDLVTRHKESLPPIPDWSTVQDGLFDAAARIQVKTINGSAKDVLDYRDHPKGLWTIAVGGDKLSRGLTLEGLTVSYFLRASQMYDTLMQMGRWFGYRPGYLDLCRLYTSGELMDWYRDIAAASEELREEFDHMAEIGATPEDYGLRVRCHPDGLLITALNKMRTGTRMSLSYAGSISETVVFNKGDRLKHNYEVFSAFFRKLREQPKTDRGYVWEDVPGGQIAGVLSNLRTHKVSLKAQAELLARYVEAQLPQGELTEWTVALISSQKPDAVAHEIAGMKIRLIERKEIRNTTEEYSIGRLVSPRDEQLGLTPEQVTRALEATRRAWKENPGRHRRKEPPELPAGPCLRAERPKKNGLLLIYPLNHAPTCGEVPYMGFAISFPGSHTARSIDYMVNKIYVEQEFGDE